MIIPQGMAYALIAGLPPIYGLYAAFIPLMVYPFFGTSPHLSVGPVAIVSILVFAGVSQWADPGSERFIELAILTSLVAGLIQVFLAIFRVGFLVHFLSEPVVVGFTTAAAIIIALSQIKYILGISIENTNSVIGILSDTFSKSGNTNTPSLIIGALAIIVIVGLKWIKKSIPGALIAVVIGTLAAFLFNLVDQGVTVIGDVPKGLPSLHFTFIGYNDILLVTPLAFVICLISFIESLAIAKTLSKGSKLHHIEANQELLGLGVAKVIGAFFQAFPNTGSFTRSVINAEAGATSGLSSIFSGLLIGIILLFLTPLFYYLPEPILGAIVIAAVVGLINIPYAIRLYQISRREFMVFLITCLLTLIMGIQVGVVAGIILSLLIIIQQASNPHFAILGQLPGTTSYRNINRYPEAIKLPGIVILRYDESIYFPNVHHFEGLIYSALQDHPDCHTIILNCAAMGVVDSTGLHKIEDILEDLDKQDVKLLFTNLRGPIRDFFQRSGLNEKIGHQNCYLSIRDALEAIESKGESGELSRKYAAQRYKRKRRTR